MFVRFKNLILTGVFLVLLWLLGLPWKLVENAVIGWISTQIERHFGIVSPTVQDIVNFAVSWGPPALGAALCVLMAYALGSARASKQAAWQSAPDPADRDETPTLPPSSQEDQAHSLSLRVDDSVRTVDGVERFCAISVRNEEPRRLEDCLVQVEEMSCKRPDGMPWPLVVKTEGQQAGGRTGGFTLRRGQVKTVPLLYRSSHRRNEWFMLDERNRKHHLPAESMTLLVVVYGGSKTESLRVVVSVSQPDWQTSFRTASGALELGPMPKPLSPDEPQNPDERDFAKGFAKAGLRKRKSPEDQRKLLAILRAEGTEIRNYPFTVTHMLADDLERWISRINKWTKEATDALKFASEADAEFLATLRNVPDPTIPAPNIRLAESTERAMYLKAYREHDYRLDRFEKMCIKHGVGV